MKIKLILVLICGLLMLVLTSCIKRVSYTITWTNYDGSFLEVDLKVLEGEFPTYDSVTPVRHSSETESYEFVGWEPRVEAATENQTYTAKFVSTPLIDLDTFTIIWMNVDGVVLETDYAVVLNTVPTYDGETPTRASDSNYRYEFSGWNPVIVPVQADTAYVAQYTSTAISVNLTYSISWLNYDGTTLSVSSNLESGKTPTYSGATPIKPADNSNTYTFAGWTPSIIPVSTNASYLATYTATPIHYMVTWLNDDGSPLLTKNDLTYGENPSYSGSTPLKPDDLFNHYTFAGWTPSVIPVNGHATYTATYTFSPVYYTVTWINYNGDVLLEDHSLVYDEVPSYPGTTPVKPENSPSKYIFNGWSPEIVAISENVTYTAQYQETPITYVITWLNYDETVLYVNQEQEIGTIPVYGGAQPTHAEDGMHDFQYQGFYPSVTPATSDTTYTAYFLPVLRTYTIVWENYNNSTLKIDLHVDHGKTPVYGPTPSRGDDDDYSYTFIGWEPVVIPAVDNQTYVAQYQATPLYFQLAKFIYPNDSYTVIGTRGNPTELVVPETYHGLPVKRIASLQNCDLLETLVVSSQVIEIAEGALSGCSALKKITIPFLGINASTIDERESQFGIIFGTASYANSTAKVQNTSTVANTWYLPKSLETIILTSSAYSSIPQYALNGITAKLFIPLSTSSHAAAFRYFNGTIYAQASVFWMATFANLNFNSTILVYTNVRSIKENSDYLYHQRNNNEIVIEKYLGSLTSIQIPNTVDDLPVTTIARYAFNNKNLTSVTFPASLTTIGERAFYGCSFTSLTLPDTILSLGSYAFGGNTALVSLIIPFVGNDRDGLVSTALTDYFAIDNIETLVVTTGYTKIGERAFFGMGKLTSLSYADVIQSIGNSAFEGCSSLASFNLPNTVTTLGNNAFYRCTSLVSITFNHLLTIGNYTFYSCLDLVELAISTLKKIGNYAFYGCQSLESISFPNVTEIGNFTFNRCTNLSNVSLTKIIKMGERAFLNCSSLTEITFPETLEEIGESAFNDCRISSLVFYGTIKKIGASAFAAMAELVSVVFFGDVWDIGDEAFMLCESLQTLSFGSSVQTIGALAFFQCTSLVSVILPNGLRSIGSFAFAFCNQLKSVVFSNNTLRLGTNSFTGTANNLEVFLNYDSINMISSNWTGWKSESDYTLYFDGMWLYVDNLPTPN